jgi:pimeloyl-ACP methyl ester carboxylesterase
MTEIKQGFAPVQHGELYYEETGSGPSLLLIHAGVADYSMWQAQFETFSEDFHVIRYDARGFGKSRTQATTFSNRQDIQDLLEHLGVEKTAVVGISRGGQIAIDYTVEHPERVWALVTVAAGISGYDHQPDGSEKSKIEYEMFNQMEELWEKKDIVIFSGAAHMIPMEQAEEFNQVVLGFLRNI